MWIRTKELSAVWGISERAIRMKVDREEITQFRHIEGNGNGRGGKVLEINISDPSIPHEIKTKILNYEAVRGRANPASGPVLPEALLPGEHGPEDRLPAHGFFSDKAKRIALARIDLLRAWENYRNAHPQKTQSDGEFIAAYNNDLSLANIREVLGPTSVKTLYRWKADINGSNDWTRLVPGFLEKKKKGPQLDEQEKKTFLKYLLNPRKFDIGAATRLTKAELDRKGTPTDKSDRTFRRFADRYKSKNFDTWILMREGEKALKDQVAPYIPRDISMLEVGDVLIADGHRLNFQVINPFTGKPCRATLIGYLDWKSWDLAGYEIMVEENVQCISSALRNSIIRLGKIPKITYQDNGKAFRARFFTSTVGLEESGIYGLFGRLDTKPVFVQPYNARGKIIERWFREFSSTFEKLMPSYTGTSIENKPAWMMRGNENFHKALHREYIPSIEETLQYMEMWLEWHRSQPCPHVKGKTVGQVFAEGQGPGVDIKDLDDLMMGIEKASIGRNGIRFLIADYYDDSLYGMREPVIIRYSLFDLSYIKVYSTHGDFICTARRVMPVHPMAAHLGDVKDMEALKQALSTQRSLKRKTIQSVKELAKRGDLLAIDWDQAGNASPSIIKSEKRETITSGPTERIPDEAVRHDDKKVTLPEQSQDPRSELQSRPIFRDEAERYSWHLEHGFQKAEDLEFKNQFEKTNLYRMLFKCFEDPEKERAALAAQS